MSFFKGIIDDLREKRLWPVALALVVALVAVPLLLSTSSNGQPLAQLPQTGPAAPAGIAVPAVSVSSTPVHSRLRGRGRDPFSQPKLRTPKTTTSTNTVTTPTGTGTTPTGTGTTPTGTGTTPTGTGTTPTSTTTTSTPTVPPARRPTELTARQTYDVTLSITNAAGGVNRIDPLERLSVLPSNQQPLLVDRGVLNGSRRLLFVVQPGTIVAGPGTCTPGPIDCELLSLGQNQIEDLSMKSPAGVVSSVAQFAVTAIRTVAHSSAAAANKLRRRESAAGRLLVSNSTLSALSLFQYKPSVGAVVDLRNLTVGGS